MNKFGLMHLCIFLIHATIFFRFTAYGACCTSSTRTELGNSNEKKWFNISARQSMSKSGLASVHSRSFSQLSFSKSVYSFEVMEDTHPGTIVGHVDAVNSEENETSVYSVQEDDGDGLFLLNPHSGEFLLSRALDFELEPYYILTAAAQQGDSKLSRVRVYFNVIDVNDNPPVFNQNAFSASVPEDSPVGMCFLSLNVSDPDEGINGEVYLVVKSGNLESKFSINQQGALCLRGELDRETNAIYNLIVQANDLALPTEARLTTSVHVTVYLLDVNDNSPVITTPSTVRFPENAPLYSVVTVIQAIDADAGSNGEVVFIFESAEEEPFSINSSTGVVYLQKLLDRETENVITVKLKVKDKGAPSLSSSMNLTVLIEDVNDHDPEFIQSSYNLSVYEDVPRGTSLLKVNASDKDIGLNGQVRFFVSESGFIVDSVLGVVSVIEKMDREKKPFYSFSVLAEDQGDVQRSATATINVTVLDVNDCVPIFSSESLTLHVFENGEDSSQHTHQIYASDEDLGVNGQLTYSLESGNDESIFSLHSNGTFQILEDLDREVKSHHMLKVIAVDSGFPSLTSTGTMVIVVVDVNDNVPVFDNDTFNTLILEDSPVGMVFLRITASDLDEGTNGQLRYSLEGLDVPFSINETSGDLFTISSLDREAVALYRFLVTATDGHPTKPFSSSSAVSVKVEDVNDNFPSFLYGPYVANVPFGITKGSVVVTVIAEDADTGLNAKLNFSLHGQQAHLFSINPSTGTVFTTDSVKRRNDITVDVHVQDGADMPKMDITTLTVRFQNDSYFPRIAVQVYKDVLSEDAATGILVATVTAETWRNISVSFYLASGNLGDVFELHHSTGELTVKDPLDFETNVHFHLILEARDSGIPPFSSYAELHLNVGDVNDNPPVFSQSIYRCDVYENLASSKVCNVLATDADSGVFAEVEYFILVGNIGGAFKIDKNRGSLFTTKHLDREKLPYYNLTLKAIDKENNSLSAIAAVIIVVLDTNDHAPRFSQIFITEVPEDAPVGFSVIQITATDEDVGLNAVIEYTIIGHYSEFPFSIDKTTGTLLVLLPLDREDQDHYILKVNANDSAWSISTDITIDITDINDNTPIFYQPLYSVTVPEMKMQEVSLLQVCATDRDLGENAHILYFIDPPNEHVLVNVSTGEISNKQPIVLRKSESVHFAFTVVASDCGSVPLNSSSIVSLTIVQYNNFPPSFLPFRPLVPVPLTLVVGTEVIQISAVDQDSPEMNNNVEYFNSGGNGSLYFEVERNSGKVLLNKTLASSLNIILTLQITVKDKGLPPLSAQTEISFEVTQENLFAPHFLNSKVEFFVPEDLPIGSVIGKIQGKDKDLGINGVIFYSFDGGNENGLFSIGHSSGLIMLVKALDFEESETHHLNVIAKDVGWHPKMGLLNITVYVTDLNDNPPLFTSRDFIATISENALIGTSVLQVWAKDADTGIHSQIKYSLIAGDIHLFYLDTKNGTITTSEIFDYEQNQHFELTVKATNIGFPYLFNVAHIHIQVAGLNEFIPAFQRHLYNFSVSEALPPQTEIGRVIAIDYDLGPDGKVFYVLAGQSKKASFVVDKHTGIIYICKDLKNRLQNEDILRVLAKNRGAITGFNVDEALIHLHILDENDPPEFDSMLYTVSVPEGISIGTSITKVKAVDRDVIPEWSRFSYSIEHGNINSSFIINPASGVILVNSHLDREMWAIYNLTVIAIDEGSPAVTGSTKVAITITDVNDNSPKLLNTEGFVRENQPAGTLVSTLAATDDDLPPNQGPFTFWMMRPAEGFSLASDGVLLTSRPFDREHNPLFHIHIVVQDAGKPPMSSTTLFNIKVLDENDNAPLQRNINILVKYYGSSFPGGLIGNVRPTDQDELDVFNCTIRNGPLRMFSFPFGMCNLWSSPYQGEATYNISVEASDQLHPSVNNSIYVNYKGFTNVSLDNCVLFYVSISTLEEFLSLKYLKFVKALDSLFNLQASKTHVFGMKLQGDKMLLLAAVKSYNGQYLTGEAASGISNMHKKLLEVQSNVTISQITSDPCMLRPCHNGATCNKNIHISQEVAVLESSSLIFVSPYFVEIFNCSCPTGFTGDACELDFDECTKEPCENGGNCYNNPGTYFCQCKEGFSGPHCNTVDNECQTVICLNGGTCWNRQGGFICDCSPGYEGRLCDRIVDNCASSPCVFGNCFSFLTGYSCQCPFGVSGINCEEHSYGFQELSFIEFPPLDPQYNFIYLEFATVQQNALLLYNHGDPSTSDFMALEIVSGRLWLSYDLGSGVIRLETRKIVADGSFHNITARRTGNVASLEIDNCSANEPQGFCLSQNGGTGTQRTLEVSSNNMTFGGVKSIDVILQRQIRTHDFVGCMRNVQVNNIGPDSLKYLASQNVLDRCLRANIPPCETAECLNEGVCQDRWSHHHCQCRDHFTGPNCAMNMAEQHVLFLNGEAYIEFDVNESYRRNQLLQAILDGKEGDSQGFDSVEIKIRTARRNAVLLVCWCQTAHIKLKISDGKPLYVFTNVTSGQQLELSIEGDVSDGQWHVLHLRRKGAYISLFVDERPVVNTTNGTITHSAFLVETIFLGTASLGESRGFPEMIQDLGFRGCVEYIKFNGHHLSFSGYNEIVQATSSPSVFQTFCVSPNRCVLTPCLKDSCLSEPCWNNSDCGSSSKEDYWCICLYNVSGSPCGSCSSDVVHSEACSQTQNSVPLWIVAIVLPIILILLILFLCIFLRRQGKLCEGEKRSHVYLMPPSKQHGTDNLAFSLGPADESHRNVSNGASKQPDLIKPRDLMQGVERCTESGPSCHVSGFGGSELEYYEIDSTYSDLKTPELKKEDERGDQANGNPKFSQPQTNHEPSPKLNQKTSRGDFHQWQRQSHLFFMRKLAPDLTGPPQHLSVDEVEKLNTPRDHKGYPHQNFRECPIKPCRSGVTETSSESESHCSFTGSEFDCERELSLVSSHDKDEHPPEAADWSRGQFILTAPSPFRDMVTSLSVHGLPNTSVSGGIPQLENLLNLGVHFNTYADVFEDIASLPNIQPADCDFQSDQEEII
ncbi:protocadherin Fat 4 [Siphateles boraxobius]|uniref:protocadherin Fat 4 n=1 Tax=Siphateles boraxobius TaxID=180520 RepID=UPI004064A92F